MLAEVFREILKYAGLTRQNPEGGDHSELKQPVKLDAINKRVCATPEEWVRTLPTKYVQFS